MWIISTNGFISLVEDRDDARMLQVRARIPEDIAQHFPDADVFTIDGADYRYRARVPRAQVVDAIAAEADAVAYTAHFKDHAIAHSTNPAARSRAYFGCWNALAQLQDYAPYSTTPRSEEPPLSAWDDDTDDEIGLWR